MTGIGAVICSTERGRMDRKKEGLRMETSATFSVLLRPRHGAVKSLLLTSCLLLETCSQFVLMCFIHEVSPVGKIMKHSA